MTDLPEKFIKWAFDQRGNLVRRQADGENIPPREIFLGFTRHTPTVITDGPAGLNGSVKGVGFIPQKRYIEATLERYMEHIEGPRDESYSSRGLRLLSEIIFCEACAEKIDFSRLGTLELAKRHTWTNIDANPIATLLFYEPPAISFEVRCDAEIHTEGPLHTFLNAQHDLYHGANRESWPNKPAYIFIIREIFDNSVGKNGFGKKIYPGKR